MGLITLLVMWGVSTALRHGGVDSLDVRYALDEPRESEQWTMEVMAPTTFRDQKVAVRHHSAGVSYFLLADEQGVRRVATRIVELPG